MFIIVVCALLLPTIYGSINSQQNIALEPLNSLLLQRSGSVNLGLRGKIIWNPVEIREEEGAPVRTFIEFKKENMLGSLEWIQQVNDDEDSWATEVIPTEDSGFIAVGCTGSRYGSSYLIIKLVEDGSVEWKQTAGFGTYAVAGRVSEMAGTGYLVTGYVEKYDGDLYQYTVKLTPSGNILSES